jgi:hypothetical protein
LAKRCPYRSRACCVDRGPDSLESGSEGLIKSGKHRLVGRGFRGWRIAKSAVATGKACNSAGGIATIERRRSRTGKTCRHSEERNRIAIVDAEANVLSKDTGDSHTETEDNAKTSPETDSKENGGSETFR